MSEDIAGHSSIGTISDGLHSSDVSADKQPSIKYNCKHICNISNVFICICKQNKCINNKSSKAEDSSQEQKIASDSMNDIIIMCLY